MARRVSTRGDRVVTGANGKKYRYPRNGIGLLPAYIRKKVRLMNQFGYEIETDFFEGCTSEIQVDQRARNVLLG